MTKQDHTDKGDLLLSFLKESESNPLVIIFSAEWHSLSDIVEIIAEKVENADKNINVLPVDADKDFHIFSSYNISTVPSAIVIKNKQLVKRLTGAFSKKTILDAVAS